MKIVASLVLLVVAAFFVFASINMPFLLKSQSARDIIYFEAFKEAAAYVDQYSQTHNQLPSDELLSSVFKSSALPYLQASRAGESAGCENGFETERSDRFILKFWRGEWTECFAFPSGRTTLVMSLSGYLLSGLGIELGVYWLIAIGSAWAAWRFWGQRRRGVRGL